MGGAVGQLLRGLPGHAAVALHDPGGDQLVARPGGVLHYHAALGLRRLPCRKAHTVVVVHILDGDRRPFPGDVVEAHLRAAPGHVHHGPLAQLPRRPGHAPAVVAVGGGEEGGLAEVPAQLFAGEVVIGHRLDGLVGLLGDVPRHGEGSAQYLEGVQAEAVALVLDIQPAQPKPPGHIVQPRQRRDGILGKGFEKRPGPVHIDHRH